MKKIILSQGMEALVDDKDYKYLSQWKWFFHKPSGGYARRTENFYKADGKRSGRSILLQNQIMTPTKGMVVDHINSNPLDNRRDNLRICTPSQNFLNKKKKKTSGSSGFKGVHFCQRSMTFMAGITVRKKHYYLGSFKNEVDAAHAYNAAALKHHGEFARLNEVPHDPQ